MPTRTLVLVSLLMACGAAFAEGELPPTMQGTWNASGSGVVGGTVIEVVKVQGPDAADVRVTMNDLAPRAPTAGITRCSFSETAVAQRQGDSWSVQVNSTSCANVSITLKWVQGKRRFEGEFKTDAGATGSLFYEWI
jgi:hypothetical protein